MRSPNEEVLDLKEVELKEYYSLTSSLYEQIANNNNNRKSNLIDQYSAKQYDFVQKLISSNQQTPVDLVTKNSNNKTYMRLLHAAPYSSNIHIYLDGSLITQLSYKNASRYIEFHSGIHQVDIYDSNNLSTPLLTQTIVLENGLFYTIAVTVQLNNSVIFQVVDDPSLPIGETKIRFIHLAYETPELDLAVKQGEGDVVFSKIAFKETSEYLALTPMSVNLELRLSGTKKIQYPLYKSKFKKNKIYDIISVGLMDKEPKFEVIMIN